MNEKGQCVPSISYTLLQNSLTTTYFHSNKEKNLYAVIEYLVLNWNTEIVFMDIGITQISLKRKLFNISKYVI